MAFKKKSEDTVLIQAPDFRVVSIPIVGTAPFVFNAFDAEAEEMMRQKQMRGSVDAPSKKAREPKDFDRAWRASLHLFQETNAPGIPCIAVKAAMVRAASLCGVEMTRAKQCLEVMPDGFGTRDEPLIAITSGTPVRFDAPVRNDGGSCDIRSRGRMSQGWTATVTIKYDAKFISQSSVANLLLRAGMQVGIGAGRPFSTKSVGQGWGTFEVVFSADELGKAAQ